MADGRRHSVDIPISRTLVALRRVRSLRDPSTNSMSKFSILLDNVKWETNSTNGISLQFLNADPEGASDPKGLLSCRNLGFDGKGGEQGYGIELHPNLEKSNSKLIMCENSNAVENLGSLIKTKQIEGLDSYGLNEEICRNMSPSKRYHSNFNDKGLVLTRVAPSDNPVEVVESCNGSLLGSSTIERSDYSVLKRKPHYENQLKIHGAVGDVASHMGSPHASINHALSNDSRSFCDGEEVDLVTHNHRGCGISYCWSRTPKFRESNPSSDVEDCPLLGEDVGDTTFHGRGCWKHINNDIIPYSESPRSLSQKFRPKSFNELVGQNVVVRSLLNAIYRGRITSLYLFHGPRGTGKTSTSRIFAAALNCLSLAESKPCGLCRECLLSFSGRSRDVKEVDSMRINRTDKLRSLIKNAVTPPISSKFKIFIVDECQLLHGDTWAAVLNSLENLSPHVVFVMITPDLDKLPRVAVSRSQRYHFLKIKDADIASRLQKICVEEGLEFDQIALDFVASKSSGSLRDAEMMLDQLSLLGRRITMSLAYELIGVVSDDELLDLLDLALSSDTSNTVRRARELMRSKIDPMQLTSQLANLIMDILAGKCQGGVSEARRKFSMQHTSEEELQKLSHALRILSETEKHLRVSKNQTTWLTVALLQLSSVEFSSPDTNDSKLCLISAQDNVCSIGSEGEGMKQLVACSCDANKSHKQGVHEGCQGTLDSIWKKVTELCQSDSFKKFLRNRGRLSSLSVNQGLAVAELEFRHPGYVSRAEKSWKLIASSLQSILGSNVEIRINLAPCASTSKGARVCKQLLSFFSYTCCRKQRSKSNTEHRTDSQFSDYTFEKSMIRDRPLITCSPYCGCQISHNCYDRMEMVNALRNSEGNVLSIGTSSSRRSIEDDGLKTPGNGGDSSKEELNNCQYHIISIEEPENVQDCFPKTFRLSKKFHHSDAYQITRASNRLENKLALSIPKKTSGKQAYICANDPCISRGSSENYGIICQERDRMEI